MRYNVKKKIAAVPFMGLLVSLVLVVGISANTLCTICQQYSPVYCTGTVTTSSVTHYEFQIGFIHSGKSCTYSTPTHWVATRCCNGDSGNHVYEDYVHPADWCRKLEEEFPCADVSNWTIDP